MHGSTRWLAAALSLALSPALSAAPKPRARVETKPVEYEVGGVTLQGTLAWDAAPTKAPAGKRPGVLVVHEWWGHNEHARRQAARLAEAGYVAFALDMYGKGKVATHPKDAEGFMGEVMKDPALAAARFQAGLGVLKADPHVDPERIAAFGYCFGGAVALTMARAGADLDAVVSFHGALDTETPAEKGKVKARILVLTGGADPFIPQEKVEAFRKEMTESGARFEIVSYPGARHSFTNPDAAKAGMEALAYDAEVDRKSFAAALKLLKEVF